MELHEFIMKLLDKNYTISNYFNMGYEAITPKKSGYNRIRYYIFKKPTDGRYYICQLTTKGAKDVEGRHIFIDDWNGLRV